MSTVKIRSAALIAAVSLLVGCDAVGGAPQIDAAAMLPGFNNQLRLSIPASFNSVPTQDGHGVYTFRDECKVYGLFARNLAKPQPATARFPWWNISTDLPINGSDIVLDFGPRRITGTIKQERWTRDSNEYFAATYEYVIPKSPAHGLQHDVGPFAIRGVFVRRPEVGDWRLQSAASDDAGLDPSQETSETWNALALDDNCEANREAANQSVTLALRAAFDQIEADLLGSGQIARGPTAETLDLLNSRLTFLLKPNGFDSLSARDSVEYCENADQGGFSDWRLPTKPEMATALNNSAFLDTPDRRLWGELTRTPPNEGRNPKSVAFFVNEVGGQAIRQGPLGQSWSQQTFSYTFENSESPLYRPGIIFLRLEPNARATFGVTTPLYNSLRGVEVADALAVPFTSASQVRVICVRNMESAATAQ